MLYDKFIYVMIPFESQVNWQQPQPDDTLTHSVLSDRLNVFTAGRRHSALLLHADRTLLRA